MCDLRTPTWSLFWKLKCSETAFDVEACVTAFELLFQTTATAFCKLPCQRDQ